MLQLQESIQRRNDIRTVMFLVFLSNTHITSSRFSFRVQRYNIFLTCANKNAIFRKKFSGSDGFAVRGTGKLGGIEDILPDDIRRSPKG